ncbi:hypothetical protein [Akkermansia massiliensis]
MKSLSRLGEYISGFREKMGGMAWFRGRPFFASLEKPGVRIEERKVFYILLLKMKTDELTANF